jgi:hypothetical protein
MNGTCRMHARLVKCVQYLVRKVRNRRLLERRRSRCEDEIKIMDWGWLMEDRFWNTVMKSRAFLENYRFFVARWKSTVLSETVLLCRDSKVCVNTILVSDGTCSVCVTLVKDDISGVLNLKYLTHFTSVWPCCIVINFFIIKPTRCTNFTNLYWHGTLHVSDGSSVHPGLAWKLSTNLYDIYHCWVYSE